ncbi:hypothetical protein ASE04_13680 [Rhizobium sp. Root708]|uniref:Uncharacterized protein n=1 Tax=Rhizobium grahamii TaxID=1120045 RepID=A0A5Q0C8K0_9HYPH|nr:MULTISPECIES: hypothetical protein [Rhizobium]KRB50961.1 hypothetical protein ASE04_13680 [Rhizobium sp. Root708]QFY60674.1 hypothetical protein FZ934_09715 [Rhizobium grahamii]QRM50189.1 hypothetical protein F3Y33_13175 [Rhizobium sp. BG6]
MYSVLWEFAAVKDFVKIGRATLLLKQPHLRSQWRNSLVGPLTVDLLRAFGEATDYRDHLQRKSEAPEMIRCYDQICWEIELELLMTLRRLRRRQTVH